jgi:hypothetical protein
MLNQAASMARFCVNKACAAGSLRAGSRSQCASAAAHYAALVRHTTPLAPSFVRR